MALDQPDRDYGWETIPTLVTNCKTKLRKAHSTILAGRAGDSASTPYMLIWGMYTGALYDLMNAETCWTTNRNDRRDFDTSQDENMKVIA